MKLGTLRVKSVVKIHLQDTRPYSDSTKMNLKRITYFVSTV